MEIATEETHEKHVPYWMHSEYLRFLIPTNELDKTARKVTKWLKTYDFDTIACRGTSGLLIGPLLAVRMKKSLIIVRKETENSHSVQLVEGDANAHRYVIVDDVMTSGRTAHFIKSKVSEFAPGAVCLGLCLVNNIRRGYDYDLKTTWMEFDDAECLARIRDGE